MKKFIINITLSVVLIMLALLIAMAVLHTDVSQISYAYEAEAQSNDSPYHTIKTNGSLTLEGDEFVFAGESYSYLAYGGFVEINIVASTGLKITTTDGDSEDAFIKNVLIDEKIDPFAVFDVVAIDQFSGDEVCITVTVMPVYATEIGAIALKGSNGPLNKENPIAVPNEKIEISIEEFIIDNDTYPLAKNVTFSDFAVSIVSTDYAKSIEHNKSIQIENMSNCTIDNPKLKFNIVIIQYRAPEAYKRLVKSVEIPIHIPVKSISLNKVSGSFKRGAQLKFNVSYNNNNVASQKGYTSMFYDLNGTAITDTNLFTKTNDDNKTGFTININQMASYGSGFRIEIISKDNQAIKSTYKVEIEQLESSFSLKYSKDYQGSVNNSSGVQLIDTQNKTQLRAGYKSDILLLGATTNTLYTPNQLRSLGVDVVISNAKNSKLIINNDGNITMPADVPAHTNLKRTSYEFEISIKDGIKNYGTNKKEVEVYKPLNNFSGGRLCIFYNGTNYGLDVTALSNTIAYYTDSDFSAMWSTDFDYSSTSGFIEFEKSSLQVKLNLVNDGGGSSPYEIKVTNALLYNGVNIDTNWAFTRKANRRCVVNLSQLVALGNEPSGRIYYLDRDIDLGAYINWSAIKNFAGILDGRNHTIKNLKFDKSVSSSVEFGLFKSLPATAIIKNINIRDAVIKIATNTSEIYCDIGIVAGTNYGTIENVNTYGTMNIELLYSYVGGIVGRNYGTIKDCLSNTWMWTCCDTGGIAGQNHAGNATDGKGIINCTRYGDYYHYIINNANRSVGGIVGYNTGAVRGCNNYGTFYIGNRDTNRGKAEYDYRCLPKNKNVHPHIGGIIGHNNSSYFDNTGEIGGRGGLTYSTIVGYDQLKYYYKNYNGRVGRSGA